MVRATYMETPSRITGVNFRTWRFGNKWLHWDELVITDEVAGVLECRQQMYGPYTPKDSAHFDQFGWCEDFLLDRQTRIPFDPKKSFVDDRGWLNVWQAGIYWCPFTFQFWTDEKENAKDPSLHELGISAWRKPKMSFALGVADGWRNNLSFKVRRHPDIRRKKDPFKEGLGKVDYWYRETKEASVIRRFLESIGRGKTLSKEQKRIAKKAIIRHVRQNAGKLTQSALMFFQMHAGASAINKALNQTTTNTCN